MKNIGIDGLVGSYQGGMFLGAAAATIGIAPFTLTAMAGTNDRLHQLAAKARGKGSRSDALDALEDGESRELLDGWIVLNWIRSGLPLLGFVIGVLAPGVDFWYS